MIKDAVTAGYTDSELEKIRNGMYMRFILCTLPFLLIMPLIFLMIFEMISFDMFTSGTVAITLLTIIVIGWAHDKNTEIILRLDMNGIRFLPYMGLSGRKERDDHEHNRFVKRVFLYQMLATILMIWTMWFVGIYAQV